MIKSRLNKSGLNRSQIVIPKIAIFVCLEKLKEFKSVVVFLV